MWNPQSDIATRCQVLRCYCGQRLLIQPAEPYFRVFAHHLEPPFIPVDTPLDLISMQGKYHLVIAERRLWVTTVDGIEYKRMLWVLATPEWAGAEA